MTLYTVLQYTSETEKGFVVILPGDYSPKAKFFHSKNIAVRYCKALNRKRIANVRRIAQLRQFITLGRTACRLLRRHYNRYVNDFDKFVTDYDYKTPVQTKTVVA